MQQQEFNKRALKLDASMDLFSDMDDSSCEGLPAVTGANHASANEISHQYKKARYKITSSASMSLFAQITQSVPFFAEAELAHTNAQQQTNIPSDKTSVAQAAVISSAITPRKRNQAAFFEQSELPTSDTTKTREITMPLALNPALRFSDDAIPVTYKENNIVMLKIMKRREEILNPVEGAVIVEHKCLPKTSTYTGLKLVALPENKWAIHDGLTNSFMNPEPGVFYAFVTMPDKTIRIMPSTQRAHLLSSNMAPVVRYAGNVVFDAQNQITSWDNISGAYRPLAELAHQAGFHPNDLCKFKKYNLESEAEKISLVANTSHLNTRMVAR